MVQHQTLIIALRLALKQWALKLDTIFDKFW